MNVSLTTELERFIAEKVKSGMYQSASEVVREGLRLLRQNDQLRAERLKNLRQDIQIGLDQLDSGEIVDGEAAFDDIRRMSRAGGNG
tara:strand:- start:451 stop:711 length:261 start_codon:yes stop_codon:yes gene_type:complete